MKQFFIVLGLSCITAPAEAQIIRATPDQAAATSAVVGLWSGYLLCDDSGYAMFYDIKVSGGSLVARLDYYGNSKGDRLIDVIDLGNNSFIFDARPSDANDYNLKLIDGFLVGEKRSGMRNDTCALRLARFTPPG